MLYILGINVGIVWSVLRFLKQGSLPNQLKKLFSSYRFQKEPSLNAYFEVCSNESSFEQVWEVFAVEP